MGPFLHLRQAPPPQLAHGQHYVLQRRELEEEKVELKNESKMASARGGAGGIVITGHQLAIDPDLAVIRNIQKTKEVQEGRLATPGGPDHGIDFPAPRRERYPAQHVDLPLPLPQRPVQAFTPQHRVIRRGRETRRHGGGRLHCAVPRITSPGSKRAARRAGIKLAAITITTEITTADR